MRCSWIAKRRPLAACLTFGALLLMPPAASSQQVRITKLNNVNFGSISNLGVDATKSDVVCVYSSAATKGYNISATGSGSGGAFTLAAGAPTLAYEVQWNDTSGQSNGTALAPGVPLGGLTTTATVQTCGSGPSTTASLIVILRTASLASAIAGAYSGSLTVVVAPE